MSASVTLEYLGPADKLDLSKTLERPLVVYPKSGDPRARGRDEKPSDPFTVTAEQWDNIRTAPAFRNHRFAVVDAPVKAEKKEATK